MSVPELTTIPIGDHEVTHDRATGTVTMPAHVAEAIATRYNELVDQVTGAYTERTRLLGHDVRLTRRIRDLEGRHGEVAYLDPADDVAEPGWKILRLLVKNRWCTWHISPHDLGAGLLDHVPDGDPDDPGRVWDGHTTDEKYEWVDADRPDETP